MTARNNSILNISYHNNNSINSLFIYGLHNNQKDNYEIRTSKDGLKQTHTHKGRQTKATETKFKFRKVQSRQP
jgi:hypothetical protein